MGARCPVSGSNLKALNMDSWSLQYQLESFKCFASIIFQDFFVLNFEEE